MKELTDLIREVQNLVNVLKTPGLQSFKEMEQLTIEEAAEILHCSPNSVRNMLKENAFKTFRYKGLIRIRKAQLEKFIANNTH